MRRLLVVLVTVIVSGACGSHAADAAPTQPFHDDFDATPSSRPRLVTNEYAYWNPGAADALVSPDWELTSGSLFTRDSVAWTGPPDDINPNATSTNGTHSAIFRLTTKRADFGNVAVSFRLRVLDFTQTPSTPPSDWDGVHVFLHYQSQTSLYYASISRRDGTVAVKKKVPGGPSNDGTYYQLASAAHAFPLDVWHDVKASVASNNDGSVTIRLYDGNVQILKAIDTGTGGQPIRKKGKVGIRGDNAEFEVDGFSVSSL